MDPMSSLISQPGTPLPPDYERRLANGALVIFGDSMLEALAWLETQGYLKGRTTVAAFHANELALPPTLMIFAILVFRHHLPGISRRGPTQEEAERWRDKLLHRLPWTEGSEPQPAVELRFNQQTPDITLQLIWSGKNVQNWQGVNSRQVKRIAMALDERYRLALRASNLGTLY
jgi:hypothetical protein